MRKEEEAELHDRERSAREEDERLEVERRASDRHKWVPCAACCGCIDQIASCTAEDPLACSLAAVLLFKVAALAGVNATQHAADKCLFMLV